MAVEPPQRRAPATARTARTRVSSTKRASAQLGVGGRSGVADAAVAAEPARRAAAARPLDAQAAVAATGRASRSTVERRAASFDEATVKPRLAQMPLALLLRRRGRRLAQAATRTRAGRHASSGEYGSSHRRSAKTSRSRRIDAASAELGREQASRGVERARASCPRRPGGCGHRSPTRPASRCGRGDAARAALLGRTREWVLGVPCADRQPDAEAAADLTADGSRPQLGERRRSVGRTPRPTPGCSRSPTNKRQLGASRSGRRRAARADAARHAPGRGDRATTWPASTRWQRRRSWSSCCGDLPATARGGARRASSTSARTTRSRRARA